MSDVKKVRVPAVPLVTHDPHFSAWSPADALYDTGVIHWTDAPHRLTGNVIVDGKPFRFMGVDGAKETLTQVGLHITATASQYRFEGAGIALAVDFTSPLLLSDLELVSRPCSYIDFRVRALDGCTHQVEIVVDCDESFCHDFTAPQPMVGGVHRLVIPQGKDGEPCAWMGLKKQTPLGNSGDAIRINWGYMYLYGGAPGGSVGTGYTSEIDGWRSAILDIAGEWPATTGMGTHITLPHVGEKEATAFVALAYDDGVSIQYFGDMRRAYWARNGETAIQMITKAIVQHDRVTARCKVFDAQLAADATALGGEEYALLTAIAYRQSVAAHKLITDGDGSGNGNVLFLSKENHSNGCIGTVDVSYPSTPLYLLYNPELVKGMIRPVLKFAQMPVWVYDFAPHDVGRYPYANGQVYALKDYQGIGHGDIFPPYYQYPASADIYDHRHQMPVEECGNMLVMIAAVLQQDPAAIGEFAQDMDLLEQWAAYLIRHGNDPGEQLCTDDFAGHLAHNANLSAKAIMGVAAMGLIKKAAGQMAEGDCYLKEAKTMAHTWESKFEGRPHTALTFADPDTWGQKYNLAWDRVFKLGLFTPSTYQREIATYLAKQNHYGLPLDSRQDYTKSDWILWCASLADHAADRQALIAPVYRFLQDSPGRVPFSDWYDTKTSQHINFKNRSVQGGIFMPLLWAKHNLPQ